MCGRYSITADVGALAARFAFQNEDLPSYKPRYNTAPTQEVLTVTKNGGSHAQYMRWGLVPFWAKDIKIGYRMINARSETVSTSNAFKNALKKRRCLVIADGFYEWKLEGSKKTPMYITLKGHEPFAFAGLWETWKSPEGNIVPSCTIITCEPNELIATIHDRMPVILPQEAEDTWLRPDLEDWTVLKSFLIPFPAGSMQAYHVSDLVNSPKNDTPECIEPMSTT